MPDIDRVVGNWYTSAHPNSHFRDRLVAARATADGRLALLNRRFTRRQNGSIVEQREISNPDELLEVLAREFGLELPSGTRFQCAGLEW
jgi:N-hydroxyarylamine O-acetyltransferase